jgi:hypothetical protein
MGCSIVRLTLVWAAISRNLENWRICEKRRTLLAVRASRVLEKSMIYNEIVNYLLASLVMS